MKLRLMMILAGVCVGFAGGFLFHRSEWYSNWRAEAVRKLPRSLANEIESSSGDSTVLEKSSPAFESPWLKLAAAPRVSEADEAAMVAAFRKDLEKWRGTRVQASPEEVSKYLKIVEMGTEENGSRSEASLSGRHLVFSKFEDYARSMMESAEHWGLDRGVIAFHDWLRKRGIVLMVVMVPNPLDIHAHDLFPSIPVDADMQPAQTQLVENMLNHGVPALDLRWAFADSAKQEAGPFFELADHRWNAEGLRLAGATVNSCLQQLPLVRSAREHAWTFQSRWISLNDPGNPAGRFVHLVEHDGRPVPTDPQSPIVMLGDCYVQMDGMADAGVTGDLASHLAQKVGLPLNCLYRLGPGPGPSTLLADRLGSGELQSLQLVIWVISPLSFKWNWMDISYDAVFERARNRTSAGPESVSMSMSRTVKIVTLPSLKPAAASPYRNILALVHAVDSATSKKLLLLVTVKREGVAVPLTFSEGSTVEIHGGPWEEKVRTDKSVQTWQQIGDDSDFAEERFWTSEAKKIGP